MSDPSLRGIRNRPRDHNRREAEVSDHKSGDSLPCDTCSVSGPLSVRMALMERDINDVREALYGDGTDRQGLIHQVEHADSDVSRPPIPK